jgi:signal transduction histidine kinase
MARILLVDDDPVIIQLYKVILRKEDFAIDIADTGASMLEAVAANKPDVILLDVILPDDSGLDLCAQLKKDPAFVGVKIILVSGMEISPAQVAEGIETGADDYLTKPFDPKELLARIKNCLKLKEVEEQLRYKNAELKDLADHLETVREEERKFLAREVQEELGQLAAALKMDVDWLAHNLKDIPAVQLERMAHASATAKTIIQTIRKIASSLRPSMLDELGLNASIDWLCREFVTSNNIPCRYDPAPDDEGLSSKLKTGLFRICQEALRNISRHAAATSVNVRVRTDGKTATLTVSDNGKGFDVDQPRSTMGLLAMRERAIAINGTLDLTSKLGEGTIISVTATIEEEG